MSPDETHLFWGQKVKLMRHKNIAVMGRGTLVSAGFYILLSVVSF